MLCASFKHVSRSGLNLLYFIPKHNRLSILISLSHRSEAQQVIKSKVLPCLGAEGFHTGSGGMASSEGNKLWGGRFEGGLDPVMEKFNASISFDKRMWREDLQGSEAWIKAICRAGLVTEEERELTIRGLAEIKDEWESESFIIKEGDEDIHTAHERRLKELVGAVAGKLHTGRSRNDQACTDTRLWLNGRIPQLKKHILNFIQASTDRAKDETDILMPGYTHLQRAQPVRWSQWLLSYCWMLRRDYDRLTSLADRVNICPLGCGAIAGNPFNIDREFLSQELGFNFPMRNSLDATSSRDFITEFLFWASQCNVNLSRLAEDLIIYSTSEFGYVTLSDAYSTGSSLMPQKKNADSLELMRGKAGTVFGTCVGMMMTVKGTPSTYNKDFQEDKVATFTVHDTIEDVLQIAAGVVATLKVNKSKCAAALSPDMLATDVAYYLVRKGVPFRDAHSMSGQCVALAENKGVPLSQLTLQDLQSISTQFSEDASAIWNYEASIEQYTSTGGTALSSVHQQIEELEEFVQQERASI